MSGSTPEEGELTCSHFEYLERLLEEGTLILGGPSLEPPFWIIVVEAESEDEARALTEADPSVAAGLQAPELDPFRASLLRERSRESGRAQPLNRFA